MKVKPVAPPNAYILVWGLIGYSCSLIGFLSLLNYWFVVLPIGGIVISVMARIKAKAYEKKYPDFAYEGRVRWGKTFSMIGIILGAFLVVSTVYFVIRMLTAA